MAIPDPRPGPDAAAERDDRQRLVWTAADALGERDTSLLDLHLRHGLDPSEIAQELRITPNNAYQLLYRLRAQLRETIGAVLLWREGKPTCHDLAGLVEGKGSFDADAAAAIKRHKRKCMGCSAEMVRQTQPELLFCSVPIAIAAAALKDQARAALAQAGVPMLMPTSAVAGVPSGGSGSSGGAPGDGASAVPGDGSGASSAGGSGGSGSSGSSGGSSGSSGSSGGSSGSSGGSSGSSGGPSGGSGGSGGVPADGSSAAGCPPPPSVSGAPAPPTGAPAPSIPAPGAGGAGPGASPLRVFGHQVPVKVAAGIAAGLVTLGLLGSQLIPGGGARTVPGDDGPRPWATAVAQPLTTATPSGSAATAEPTGSATDPAPGTTGPTAGPGTDPSATSGAGGIGSKASESSTGGSTSRTGSRTTTAGGKAAGGKTAAGRTTGGKAAGSKTAGGKTAGGKTAGGKTAGGKTAGSKTADGRTDPSQPGSENAPPSSVVVVPGDPGDPGRQVEVTDVRTWARCPGGVSAQVIQGYVTASGYLVITARCGERTRWWLVAPCLARDTPRDAGVSRQHLGPTICLYTSDRTIAPGPVRTVVLGRGSVQHQPATAGGCGAVPGRGGPGVPPCGPVKPPGCGCGVLRTWMPVGWGSSPSLCWWGSSLAW